MLQKTQQYPRRTEQEWMDLIQQCRTSGMSDKDWCDQHHIHRSNFYYHIRKFRNKACAIPQAFVPPVQRKQEVVQIQIETPESFQVQAPLRENRLGSASETAIHLNFHGFHLEITNAAASETITNTIAALQRIC